MAAALRVPLETGVGCAVASSPFVPGRLAVATAANFGIVGHGRLSVHDISAGWPSGELEAAAGGPSYLCGNAVFDVAWSEFCDAQLIGACGDGVLRLYDLGAHTVGRPLAAYAEHCA